MKSKNSFLIRLIYITLLTELISFGWWFFMPPAWVTPTIFVLPLFFLGLTLIIHDFITKGLKGRFQNFLNRYLVVVTVKLLFLLTIITIYIFKFPEDGIAFVLTLFANYVIFSVFEASVLVKTGRAHDEASKGEK